MESDVYSTATKAIASPFGAGLGGILTWLASGWTTSYGPGVSALFVGAGGIFGLAFAIIYRRYLGILASGTKRRGSLERHAYDALRDNLSGENLAARLYSQWLGSFLRKVDRFFGDSGMVNYGLFPNAFGLHAPAHLWTTAAFERCLVIATIYPIISIFLIWIVTNHVSGVETAIGLNDNIPGWQRALAAVMSILSVFSLWRSVRTHGRVSLSWLLITGIPNLTLALAISIPFALSFCFAITVAIFMLNAGPVASAAAVALAFSLGLSIAFFFKDASLFSYAFAMTFTLFFLASFSELLTMHFGALSALSRYILDNSRRRALSLIGFWLAITVATLIGAFLLAPLRGWSLSGPMLLYLGLIPLLNAPFDWLSLGLTRALLRRGLEKSGWWPVFFALLDAVLAVVIVALLLSTTVIGVQAFDDLVASTKGVRLLPLDELFNGIAAHPLSPEYWWIYALLLTTVVPSLINLMIGGASLTRGVPWVPGLLLPFVPSGRAVPVFDRAWIALFLTLQILGGALLGALAQVVILGIGIFHVMPWLGLGLLDMARFITELNIPLLAWRWLRGG